MFLLENYSQIFVLNTAFRQLRWQIKCTKRIVEYVGFILKVYLMIIGQYTVFFTKKSRRSWEVKTR